jgi:hypothetical protein
VADVDPDRDGEPADAEHAPAGDRPIDRFRRTTAGTIVAAGLLGLRDALEGRPEREEPAIVAEAPTRPHDRMELLLDPDDPSRSKVVIHTLLDAPDDPAR